MVQIIMRLYSASSKRICSNALTPFCSGLWPDCTQHLTIFLKGNFAGASNLGIFGKQYFTKTPRAPLPTLTRSAWAQYCIVQFCIRSAHGRWDHDITIWNISIIAYDRCGKVRSVKWRKSNKNYLRHKNSIKALNNRTRDTEIPMYVTKRMAKAACSGYW